MNTLLKNIFALCLLLLLGVVATGCSSMDQDYNDSSSTISLQDQIDELDSQIQEKDSCIESLQSNLQEAIDEAGSVSSGDDYDDLVYALDSITGTDTSPYSCD